MNRHLPPAWWLEKHAAFAAERERLNGGPRVQSEAIERDAARRAGQLVRSRDGLLVLERYQRESRARAGASR